MPTNWRPVKPFKTKTSRSIFSKSSTEPGKPCNNKSLQTTSQSVALAANKERPHKVEKILEIQKIVLQKIAWGENTIKGFQDRKYPPDTQKIIDNTKGTDLEE